MRSGARDGGRPMEDDSDVDRENAVPDNVWRRVRAGASCNTYRTIGGDVERHARGRSLGRERAAGPSSGARQLSCGCKEDNPPKPSCPLARPQQNRPRRPCNLGFAVCPDDDDDEDDEDEDEDDDQQQTDCSCCEEEEPSSCPMGKESYTPDRHRLDVLRKITRQQQALLTDDEQRWRKGRRSSGSGPPPSSQSRCCPPPPQPKKECCPPPPPKNECCPPSPPKKECCPSPPPPKKECCPSPPPAKKECCPPPTPPKKECCPTPPPKPDCCPPPAPKTDCCRSSQKSPTTQPPSSGGCGCPSTPAPPPPRRMSENTSCCGCADKPDECGKPKNDCDSKKPKSCSDPLDKCFNGSRDTLGQYLTQRAKDMCSCGKDTKQAEAAPKTCGRK